MKYKSASDLAQGSPGYDPARYTHFFRYEENHWWFKNRNTMIIHAIRRSGFEPRDYLEVGCGTGIVLRAVTRAFPACRSTGTEIHAEGLAYARVRLPDTDFLQMDARSIPFTEHFDMVGMFDVLEHIEEDERVLGQVRQALKPGGRLLMTVPQHPWLWSHHDERARHVRRYRRPELLGKLRRASFELLHVRSFVSLLLPLMWATRRRHGAGTVDEDRELAISSPVNTLLGAVMWLERGLGHIGFQFPFGGSLLVVASRVA